MDFVDDLYIEWCFLIISLLVHCAHGFLLLGNFSSRIEISNKIFCRKIHVEWPIRTCMSSVVVSNQNTFDDRFKNDRRWRSRWDAAFQNEWNRGQAKTNHFHWTHPKAKHSPQASSTVCGEFLRMSITLFLYFPVVPSLWIAINEM